MWSAVSKNGVQIHDIEETVWSRQSVQIKHKYKHTGKIP